MTTIMYVILVGYFFSGVLSTYLLQKNRFHNMAYMAATAIFSLVGVFVAYDLFVFNAVLFLFEGWLISTVFVIVFDERGFRTAVAYTAVVTIFRSALLWYLYTHL